MRNYRQGRLDKLFDITDIYALVWRSERYGAAFMACSAGTPYTVNIVFRILWKIVVYHKLYPHHIYAARRYIGGY